MTAQPVVSIVGAGPGDPELLTRRAWQRLRTAEAVFYDGLVPTAIVRAARDAKRTSVARLAGPKAITDAEVAAAVIASAKSGKRTVRLKAGDPFVLGRGWDEVAAFSSAGVSCEVVPGLSSVTAAPLLAGIPLTVRGMAPGFLAVSGHASATFEPVLSGLRPGAITVVVLMGMQQREALRDLLLSQGWDRDTPAAVIIDASRPQQRRWLGPLRDLSDNSLSAPGRPGVIVIGPAVACAIRIPHVNR